MHGLKMAIGIGVTLLMGISPAKAEQRWVVIQKDTDETVYLADSDQITDDLSETKTFWTHAIYEIPRYGMKSLKVENTVHCHNRTLKELRYIEYDTQDNVVFSGTYSIDSSPKPVLANSVADQLLTFACSSGSVRKQAYIENKKSGGNREPGSAAAKPPEIVSFPLPRPATQAGGRISDAPEITPSVYRYRECVLNSVRKFAKLQETDLAVVVAAMSNCRVNRMQVVSTYAISMGGSSEERSQFILQIDERMKSLAEREVVNLRPR
ncbi:surface-adhesin E family protein [Sphingorhabdus sp.]|uniref:surface-adhesin E family protein n=1 Tax=Sphingorhabdus sp. TaxID=1902408 RepID=UPI003919DE5A